MQKSEMLRNSPDVNFTQALNELFPQGHPAIGTDGLNRPQYEQVKRRAEKMAGTPTGHIRLNELNRLADWVRVQASLSVEDRLKVSFYILERTKELVDEGSKE